MKLLQPRESARSIFEIDYPRLYRAGKRAILFDLDNTLGRRRARQLDTKVIELLANLAELGFRIGILTNRHRLQDDPVIAFLSSRYPLLHTAKKPRKSGFRKLLSQLGALPEEAVMIGDRRLTDVFGANRLGIYTILIRRRVGEG